jgi:hypothetical protein
MPSASRDRDSRVYDCAVSMRQDSGRGSLPLKDLDIPMRLKIENMARLEIDFLTDYDDASLLAELKRVAKVTGSDTVTRADIDPLRLL